MDEEILQLFSCFETSLTKVKDEFCWDARNEAFTEIAEMSISINEVHEEYVAIAESYDYL